MRRRGTIRTGRRASALPADRAVRTARTKPRSAPPTAGSRLLGSRAATLHWGERLGRLLRPGDVLALIGPLGAGKTTLLKGVARGLGVPDAARRVVSPTFVLQSVHRGRFRLYHYDLLRLPEASEIYELGLDDALRDGVVAVEWADRLKDPIPGTRCVTLTLGPGPTEGARTMRVRAEGEFAESEWQGVLGRG